MHKMKTLYIGKEEFSGFVEMFGSSIHEILNKNKEWKSRSSRI